MEKEKIMSVANLITSIRVIMIFIAVWLLSVNNYKWSIIACFLIITAFLMDFLDGLAARKFNSITIFGGIYDIMADRVVENTLWIAFTYLGYLPLWIPITILTRGFIVDGIRNYVLTKKNKTAFGKDTMMMSKLGRMFVSSRVSRTLYAAVKAIVFVLLSLKVYIEQQWNSIILDFNMITLALVYVTVLFCIIRGMYVILDSLKYFTKD